MNSPFLNMMYGVKSKNVGPFLAFSESWFEKYQPYLLFLLNVPILRLWFRWILRIHKDCKYNDVIVEIQPNNYKVLFTDGQIKGDFRTHQKFSKRIYFAFRWWWWMLHYFDEVFKPFPSLQFGFDTLTAYPDADPESSTVDGRILYSGAGTESFSTIRNKTEAAVSYSTATAGIISSIHATYQGSQNTFDTANRGIFLFSTNIGAGSSISDVTLSMYYYAKNNGLGSTNLHCVSSNPASNTELSYKDWNKLGFTSFGYISYASYTASQYNSISLNSTGIDAVSKTAISKFGTVNEWEINNSFGGSWVQNAQTAFQAYFADQTGTANDPKLLITYSTSSIKKVCGVDYANVKTCGGVAKISLKKILGVS